MLNSNCCFCATKSLKLVAFIADRLNDHQLLREMSRSGKYSNEKVFVEECTDGCKYSLSKHPNH